MEGGNQRIKQLSYGVMASRQQACLSEATNIPVQHWIIIIRGLQTEGVLVRAVLCVLGISHNALYMWLHCWPSCCCSRAGAPRPAAAACWCLHGMQETNALSTPDARSGCPIPCCHSSGEDPEETRRGGSFSVLACLKQAVDIYASTLALADTVSSQGGPANVSLRNPFRRAASVFGGRPSSPCMLPPCIIK